jgi:hypothetical protein
VLPTRIKEAVITCQVEIRRILYGAGIHVCPGAPSARLSCVFFARSCYAAPVSNQPRGRKRCLRSIPGAGSPSYRCGSGDSRTSGSENEGRSRAARG